jgi:hypothetical protein
MDGSRRLNFRAVATRRHRRHEQREFGGGATPLEGVTVEVLVLPIGGKRRDRRDAGLRRCPLVSGGNVDDQCQQDQQYKSCAAKTDLDSQFVL